MKNSSPLHDEYMLAVLIGALIFATGYFVRDFNTFSSHRANDNVMLSGTLPPPPPNVPPPPPFTVSALGEILVDGVPAEDAVMAEAPVMEEEYMEEEYVDPWMSEEEF